MSLQVVLSPAKSLDFETPASIDQSTKPEFIKESKVLVDILRGLTPTDLSALMSISEKLGILNAARFEKWSTHFSKHNAKQAILAFNGDVYDGLDAKSLNEQGFVFAQKHIRILSGLYGVLKPLDLLQPYRLEMSTKLSNPVGMNLYSYWKPHVVKYLNAEFGEDPVLVNLASDEYFKSVDLKLLKARVVQPVFQDFKNDKYKVISFFAKKARGLMARYIIDNRVTQVEQLKNFAVNGYAYDSAHSSESIWVFRRKEI